MKHALRRLGLLAAAALTLGAAQAQQAVPNGTLETWTTRNGSDAPAQWLTTDDLAQTLLPGFPSTGAINKSTSAHAGSFAAKLNNVQTLLGVVPGYLILGNRLGDPDAADFGTDLGGVPYTSRAARLQFYYKFTGTIVSPDDRPSVSLTLTKTTGGVRRVVAAGQLFLPAAANYTLADLPLTYQLGVAPDSLHLVFSSADDSGSSYTAGNSLYVDDVVLAGTVAATRDARLQAAVGVYPNPSPAGLFTLTTAEPALLSGAYTVTDALGRVVLRQPAAPANATGARAVDLRTQPAGVYSLRLDTPRGPVVHQLLIP